MPYRDDILALAPDHYWTWDNTHDDIGVGGQPRPTNQAGGNSAPLSGAVFTEDASASLHVTDILSRTECADSIYMNTTSQPFRSFGGWFMPVEISRPPSALFKEGGGTNNFAVLLGFGNVMLAQSVDRDDHDVQVYSDRPLKPNRAYHYICTFKASDSTAANNGEFALFIDGIKQSISSGNPFDTTQMAGHSADIDWGDPDGSLNVGGTGVGFAAAVGYHAHFASWRQVLTDAQIRDMFERGAKPDVILSGTLAQIQNQLGALSGTQRADAALAIRVEQASDAADFMLSADSVTFDPQCSIDVQYTGPNILTWVNNNGSNASVGSAPGGGSIIFQTPRAVTLDGLTSGTRVKVYRISDNMELAGVESSGASFTAFVNAGEQVTVRMASLTRRITEFDLTVPDTDTTIPISQQLDRVYGNG